MSMEAPAALAPTAAPGPVGDPFAGAQAPAASAPVAPQAAPAQSFKVGSIVKDAQGKLGVVVAVGAAPREQLEVDTNGTPTGRKVLADLEGYRIAYFASVIDSPHTVQELGLQAP